MKKLIILFTTIFLYPNTSKACADYSPDYEYFNLFAQELIQVPEYHPFLLTYESSFYDSETKFKNENIESWQKYFGKKISYDETLMLIYNIDKEHIINWAKGKLSHDLTKKLGISFFSDYKQGLLYLIKAKELEPYMSINHIPNENYFYYDNNRKNATNLNYTKTMSDLLSGYKKTTDKEIKLRYAYQIVRFNHYTRNYQKAINYFDKLVKPLNLHSPIYYYALQQVAGAQNGMGKSEIANWNFFQVFIHSRDLKQSSYTSMKLSNSNDFNGLLSRTKSPEEKNMAYFLLAYNDFNNPIPIIEKMLQNNANSKILKVLVARSINELERNILLLYHYCDNEQTCIQKHLPTFPENSQNYAKDLQNVITKIKSKSNDNFWKISDAYLHFLNKNYKKSNNILNQIKTDNTQYIEQIEKMKMLNEIVSQKKITPEFENILMNKYSKVLLEKSKNNESEWYETPNTKSFIVDILANRYLLDSQNAKSFLLTNHIKNLLLFPDLNLTQEIEKFIKKTNKTSFEKLIIQKSIHNTDYNALLQLIYGDHAMREANFTKAKKHYKKAKSFNKIFSKQKIDNEYDGYNNISHLVFGHNVWESFESNPEISMKAYDTTNFPFIKKNMNKLELANALINLNKIGNSKSKNAINANQLIGNVLYNTTILGYFRELFSLDINNMYGSKFNFNNPKPIFHHYYKDIYYKSYIKPDNFNLAIKYYQKALKNSNDMEQRARILFQMASAEQGNYYQWAASQNHNIEYSEPNYSKKIDDFETQLILTKTKNFRYYFAELKKNYANTKTVNELKSSCIYFEHYMKK